MGGLCLEPMRRPWARTGGRWRAMHLGLACAGLLLTMCPAPALGFGTVVRTTVGTVRGAYADGVAVFVGIPYAMPPVGKRRFLPPEPAPVRPRGAISATSFRPDCLQSRVANSQAPDSQAEDCLYLNIWAPTPRASGVGASLRRELLSTELRPVLVFLHGGAFRSGGTSMPCYNGSALARRADALVVTVNYRLGPFGFLVSARDGLVGNAGLADQKLALRWIARYIYIYTHTYIYIHTDIYTYTCLIRVLQ
ncbi:Carboxylesterase family-domain-containing protein [Pavlovales sp. CCMP2436]|nr:Carboxylesterase family-domain-containing protein [Pavlovales sp. CCMP2436]